MKLTGQKTAAIAIGSSYSRQCYYIPSAYAAGGELSKFYLAFNRGSGYNSQSVIDLIKKQ